MLKLGPDLFARLNAGQRVGNQTKVIYGQGGLSKREISAIEKELGFPWPEDFKYLFANVRDPGGVLFPWKDFDRKAYDERMAWVWEGIEFDIDKNKDWLERWGARPDDLSAAIEIARRDFPNWPKLLPVYGHRFLAAEPCLPDNPVFSIVQTDIILYGANLAHYLVQEFLDSDDDGRNTYRQNPRAIAVWSNFLR